MAHQELGRKLLDQLAEDVAELAKVDTPPKVDGRNMTMVLGPYKEAITHKAGTQAPVRERHQRSPEPEPVAAAEAEPEEQEAAPEPAQKRPVKITRAEGG